jgi:hypothetical protein
VTLCGLAQHLASLGVKNSVERQGAGPEVFEPCRSALPGESSSRVDNHMYKLQDQRFSGCALGHHADACVFGE